MIVRDDEEQVKAFCLRVISIDGQFARESSAK